MKIFHYCFQRGFIFNHILSASSKKKEREINQEITLKKAAYWQANLDNPCEAGAERCQGRVDLWFDIAMKSAHYLKTVCLHIEDRKLNNLLI